MSKVQDGQQKGCCALCKQGSDNVKQKKTLPVIIVGAGVVTVVTMIKAKCSTFVCKQIKKCASLSCTQNVSTLELNVIKQEWEVWFYMDGPTGNVTIPYSHHWISHTNVITTGTFG